MNIATGHQLFIWSGGMCGIYSIVLITITVLPVWTFLKCELSLRWFTMINLQPSSSVSLYCALQCSHTHAQPQFPHFHVNDTRMILFNTVTGTIAALSRQNNGAYIRQLTNIYFHSVIKFKISYQLEHNEYITYHILLCVHDPHWLICTFVTITETYKTINK